MYSEITTPAAAKLAAELMALQVGAEFDPEKATIKVYKFEHEGRSYYPFICVQAFSGGMGESYLNLNESAWREFLYWSYFKQAERKQEIRDLIITILRDHGHYPKDTVGLRIALKIYEMLRMAQRPLTARELIKLEIELEAKLDGGYPMEHADEELVSSLAAIRGKDDRITLTSQRALRALSDSGLILKIGKGSGIRYQAQVTREIAAAELSMKLGI